MFRNCPEFGNASSATCVCVCIYLDNVANLMMLCAANKTVIFSALFIMHRFSE